MEERQFKKYIVISVLLSFISGALGGVAATKNFMKASSVSSETRNIELREDSAIIDVVKKTGPAVVSIVISQDVNKYLNSFDPFDPFSPYFGFGFNQRQQAPQEPDFRQVGAGTGFFVSADGIILTNKHVVSDETAKYTVITQDKKQYEATVLARDPRTDLAIVKVEIKDAPHLEMADADIQIGQRVVAIGNSLGQYPNTVTSGIVSGIGRSISASGSDGREDLEGVIQTDAAINPGNSGGPLLNLAGQVIGINTAVDRQGQLVGFAIPAKDASRSLDSYKKNGKITRPYLGVRYVLINEDLAKENKLPKDHGALVVRGQNITDLAVIPGSPADKAGIGENDIILEVDGKKIDPENSLVKLLKDKQSGDEVSLKVYSKGSEKDIKVKLEDSK